jgi:hypothetical protein
VSEQDVFSFLQYILHALRHLTSPCLREVTILLPSADGLSLDFDAWSEPHPLLESPRFLSTLVRLTFRFPAWCQPEVTAENQPLFAKTFPLCAERGILHVERA